MVAEYASSLPRCNEHIADAGSSPLFHRVAVSTAILVACLRIAYIDYQTHFDGTRRIHFPLGPATVALAVRLYQQIKTGKRNWFALFCGALLGSASAVGTAMWFALLCCASRTTVLSISAKSVAMPIAIVLTDKLGSAAPLPRARSTQWHPGTRRQYRQFLSDCALPIPTYAVSRWASWRLALAHHEPCAGEL